MIVDLRLAGKRALVVGGGAEALRRASQLLREGCEVSVVARSACPGIARLAGEGRIALERRAVRDARLVAGRSPDVVIAATSDAGLNGRLVGAARRRRILAYRSDSAAGSDFAHLAVAEAGPVRVAVSTGGRSPAMARRIRGRIAAALEGAAGEDGAWLGVLEHARGLARGAVPTQAGRRRYLRAVEGDAAVDRLIRAGRPGGAKRRAAAMLEDGTWG